MSLRSRLRRLEAAREVVPHVPRVVDYDSPGVEIGGQLVTWEQFDEQYPDHPRPVRWPCKTDP